jgi:RNA polymerase II transcription mediator complex subunit 9
LHTLLSKLLPAAPDAPPSLDPQHLATEAGAIKLRLRAARVTVEALGDMNRGIEEQEEEIRALEEKCEKQREVLRGLVDVIKTGQATAMELD